MLLSNRLSEASRGARKTPNKAGGGHAVRVKLVQRKLMKDGIFASMDPPPFYGIISFDARSSQIVSEFIPGPHQWPRGLGTC
jgi:hypothetical protein